MSTHRYGAVVASPRLCKHCGRPTREHVYACGDLPTSWKRRPTDIFACEVCDRGFASSDAQEKHLKSTEHRDAVKDARYEARWAQGVNYSTFGHDVAYAHGRGTAYDAPYRLKVKAQHKAKKRGIRASRRGLRDLGLTNKEVALLLHAAAEEHPATEYARTMAEGDEPGACPECFSFHAWEDCPRNPEND